MRLVFTILVLTALVSTSVAGAEPPDRLVAPYTAEQCSSCAEWNAPREPFRVFGNTWYVGTEGLAAILVTSPEGHVLLDGGLPDSAPQILANIEKLGFEAGDVALILNTHAHFDHSGGIGALQRATGARVAASAASAPVLESGQAATNDPQHAHLLDFPPVTRVERFTDGATLKAGSLALTAHATGGHSPGGTSWSWTSCEGETCLRIVYADSLTPITGGSYRYSDHKPALDAFAHGFATFETMQCDLLLTPHPGASSMWERLAKGGLVDPDACRAYAATGRKYLASKLGKEGAEQEQ